jgi:hypothetical protein
MMQCMIAGADVVAGMKKPRHHRQTFRRCRGGRRAQDLDAAGRGSRPLARNRGAELIGSILEMAKLTKTAPPSIEAVSPLMKLVNKVMLLEGGGVKGEKVSRAA